MSIFYPLLYKISALLIGLSVCYWLLARLGLKKFFPFLLLIVTGACFYFFSPVKEPPQTLTPEQKSAIILEQMEISNWYAAYRKDVEQLDQYWSQYHRTLKAFKNDEISIQTIYIRFFEIQKKTAAVRMKYEQMQPPGNLSDHNAALAAEIIRKTAEFSGQQADVLQHSTDAIAPKNLKTDSHDEQVQILERIMILENPLSLDIADEIIQIRENLVIAGEK